MPHVRASFQRIEYVPEFGAAVRIAEFDRPMQSDDEETAQTITYMDELAARDSNLPAVSAAVDEALDDAGMDRTAAPLAIAAAVYHWLQKTIRYVPTPGTSPLVDQTLITPAAVLAMPEPIGDCPQFSMLAAAMFRVLCMPSLFVTIAADERDPDQWSHVYNTVEIAPGRFLAFDSSNGPAPGAEYAKPFKRRVWPRLTPGICRTKEGSRDMMRTFPRPAGMRNRITRRAVLGDLCLDESCQQMGPTPTDVELAQPIYPTTVGTYGSAAQPWWTTLVNDATQLATPLIRSATQQAPYYVTSPSGQSVLYNPNTGNVANASSIGSAINPTYLVLGVALIAGFALIGKK